MVVPWVGFPLHNYSRWWSPPATPATSLSKRCMRQNKCSTKIASSAAAAYPYVEGLRLDEAMHPLTLMSVGVYGKALPPQNGAPIRLTVPWKYGFKGIKSIVSIELTRERPPTTGIWRRRMNTVSMPM